VGGPRMPKQGRDTAMRAGEKLLAEWGVADEAPVGALAAVAGRDAAADLAIACRLGAVASEEVVPLLQKLQSEGADKAVRKEARRSMYRIEQRGVAVPHGEPATTVSAAPALEGYVSPVDGRGDQLVWILKPRPGGVLHLFAVINDPAGLREVSVSALSRKALREIRVELLERHELRLVEIDWRYADFTIHRAFAWARERDARIEGDYLAQRSQLITSPAPEEVASPLWQHIDRADVEEDRWLQSSVELLGEPELRTWFLPPEQMAPFSKELEELRDSPLVLNQAQQEERFGALIGRAVEEVFAVAGRESWARRLEEMAYFMVATARPERARAAAAAAAALRHDRPYADVPVLAGLVRSVLAASFETAQRAEAERQQSSLIVTPEQMREQQRRKR
jgi:hypothetical protein